MGGDRLTSPHGWFTQAEARSAVDRAAWAEARVAAAEEAASTLRHRTSEANRYLFCFDSDDNGGAVDRAEPALCRSLSHPSLRSASPPRSSPVKSAPVKLLDGHVQPGALHAGLVVSRPSAYVPRRVVQAYCARMPPVPPCAQPLRAVFMLADVSGYSLLTRWMAQHYEQGAWAVSRLLDGLFGSMVDTVHARGGDVWKFCGDALLVGWPCEHGHREAVAAARAAAACALHLLQAPQISPSDDEPPLELHIALHTGLLTEMHLGNGDATEGRWEHACFGQPLTELGPLLTAARPGECVASGALWCLLDHGGTKGRPCVDGSAVLAAVDDPEAAYAGAGASPPPSAQIEAALACYLPPVLADTLAAGGHGWGSGCLRVVSVLFISLPPFDARHLCSTRLMQSLVAEVHCVVARLGGLAQQSLADDKGVVSLAVWGKPPTSSADDPRRAVTAARELAVSLTRIAAAHGSIEPVCCGVATGRALCGNVGLPERCEWAVVGQPMNDAARLMGAAQKQRCAVLCCAATAAALRTEAAELGAPLPAWLQPDSAMQRTVVLKGGVEVPVFAPEEEEEEDEEEAGPRVSMLYGSALLGREEELLRVAKATAIPGGLMIICGALSEGKSTLLRAAQREASARGTLALQLASGGAGAISAFDVPWFAQAAARNLPALPPSVRSMAPLLSLLLSPSQLDIAQLATEGSSSALEALADDAARRDAAAALTVALLAEEFSQMTILFGDDDVALDDTSAAVLVAVHAALAPAVVFAVSRSQAADPNSPVNLLLATMQPAAPAVLQRVTLQPLSHHGISALVALEACGEAALPDNVSVSLVAALARLTGGHPLLVRELAALLKREGMLLVDPVSDRVRLQPGVSAAELPNAIARALADDVSGGAERLLVFNQRRLDMLSPRARYAAKVASVLGGVLEPDKLAQAMPNTTLADVNAFSCELVVDGIWTPVGKGDALSFRFSTEALRSLIYTSMTVDECQGMYAQVLEVLEAQLVLTEKWSELARLASGAQRHEKAACWALQAAHAAAVLGGGQPTAARCAQVGLDALEALRLSRARFSACLASGSAQQQEGAACSSPSAPFVAPGPFHGGALDAPRHSNARSSTSFRCSTTRTSSSGIVEEASPPLARPRRSSTCGPSAPAVWSPRMSRTSCTSLISPPGNALPEHATLTADLHAVLAVAAEVRASTELVQPGMLSEAFTAAFVARCPALLTDVRSRTGRELTDPVMGPLLLAHQKTLLRLVLAVLSGEHEPAELSVSLQHTGRMHARFGADIESFLPHCGAAMVKTVKAALGKAAFGPSVEAAWKRAWEVLQEGLLAGIAQVRRERQEETRLKAALLEWCENSMDESRKAYSLPREAPLEL